MKALSILVFATAVLASPAKAPASSDTGDKCLHSLQEQFGTNQQVLESCFLDFADHETRKTFTDTDKSCNTYQKVADACWAARPADYKTLFPQCNGCLSFINLVHKGELDQVCQQVRAKGGHYMPRLGLYGECGPRLQLEACNCYLDTYSGANATSSQEEAPVEETVGELRWSYPQCLADRCYRELDTYTDEETYVSLCNALHSSLVDQSIPFDMRKVPKQVAKSCSNPRTLIDTCICILGGQYDKLSSAHQVSL